MGVSLRESTHRGIIISRSQVILICLLVQVFPAVAEGIGVGSSLVLLVAESVVGICFRAVAGGVGEVYHIPMGIVQVVLGGAAHRLGDQVDAPEVTGGKW